MLFQNSVAFGASGRIAPTPTIAIARCAEFSMTFLVQRSMRLSEEGGQTHAPPLSTLEGNFPSEFGYLLLHAPIKNICDVVHVVDQTKLRAANCCQSKALLESRDFGFAYASETDDPSQSVLCDLHRGLTREDPRDCG